MNLNFTEKLGPLPIWVWGAISAGVVLVAYFVYSRMGGVSHDTGESVSSSTGQSFDDRSPWYATTGVSASASDASPQITDTDTNAKWINRAAKAVADRMGIGVSDVTATLQRYVNGFALAPREKKVVDEALTSYSQPPQGVAGSGSNKGEANFRLVYNTSSKSTGNVVYKLYDDGTVLIVSTQELAALKENGYKITGGIDVDKNATDLKRAGF